MNWSDEKYVKLYTRDTLTWRAWPWQARCVWPLITRKLDGAGLIETGTMEPALAISMQIDVPVEVVRPGLAAIMESGTLEVVSGGLLAPKYVEAQEARKTEAQKKRDQRERHRDQRRAAQVDEIRKEPVPTASPVVTECPPPAQPSPAQLSPDDDGAVPVAAFALEAPPIDNIESWSKEDFWRAAELTRRALGYPPQKWPSRHALGRWWAEARGVADVAELARAFEKFARDKHWSGATPPAPFEAFASKWNAFLPKRGAAA